MPKFQALTITGTGVLREIRSNCGIAQAFDHVGSEHKPFVTFSAIWDTGATGTCVTKNVVDQVGLKPISMAKAQTAGGLINTEVYLVNILLPNRVGYQFIHVTRADIGGADVLIGMDLITTGDFVITNKGGKTVCSFRFPSQTKIDFVVGSQTAAGRNDPCPCGSGKKYKQCCGNFTN